MIQDNFEMVAPAFRELLPGEWDEVDQEPNLVIFMRSRRRIDDNGVPCSDWEYGYTIEGVARGPMSQPQRDYAATLMRHTAWLIQDKGMPSLDSKERVAAIARRYRAEITATMNGYANLAEYLVRQYGLHEASSLLGLMQRKVRHLLQSRGRPARLFLDRP